MSFSTCPNGTTQDGPFCESTRIPICPPSTTYISNTIDGSKCRPNIVCPINTVLNNNVCVSNTLPVCPDNTSLINDKCISNILPNCNRITNTPSNTPSSAPSSSLTFTLKDNSCITCPKNFNLQEDKCESNTIQETPGNCPTIQTPSATWFGAPRNGVCKYNK